MSSATGHTDRDREKQAVLLRQTDREKKTERQTERDR